MRQLGEMWPDQVLEEVTTYRPLLDMLLAKLAELLGCAVEDLRLDHDPPLALRPQERRGLGKKIYYIPDANDPEHLNYRPHGAQFAGSHDVKTRIRGEHGQFSDVQLIKRQRRRERKAAPKQACRFSRPQKRTKKSTWPKNRKLQSRSNWPKRTGHR